MILATQKSLVKGFRWRDRNDKMWDPKEMSTRHLFFTVRMIWNHTMPTHVRSKNYIQYSFGKKYSPKYMAAAILALGSELLTRGDIEPEWWGELFMWRNWLTRRLTNGEA